MIEPQLRQHLISQESLKPYLATFADQMAIFNQEAPADTDEGWGSGSQYGRILFNVQMDDDPERKVSGNMIVDVMCEEGQQIPEEIEPIIRELIDGYFFSNPDVTIAAQWSSSRYFTEPPKKVIGVTLTFKLLDFPTQITTDPDPIALINEWTAKELPAIIGSESVRVIGRDELPAAWKPTNELPAIFWRLGDIQPAGWIPDTYNCSWQTAQLHGHVMAPDNHRAILIARLINNTLTIKKRLIFEDKAPLMVDRNIRVTPKNDHLRIGQIVIDATYGILNIPPSVPKMDNISMA